MTESESVVMFELLWKGIKGFITVVGAIVSFITGGPDEEEE